MQTFFILIVSGVLASFMASSNIYAQNDLNFQYGNYPKNLLKTVEKASQDLNSVEMKLLQCVTFVNSASLGQTLELYNQTWSDIKSIMKSKVSVVTKTNIITFKWNAIDTSNSQIPFVIDLCAKTYEGTGKFIQELQEWM